MSNSNLTTPQKKQKSKRKSLQGDQSSSASQSKPGVKQACKGKEDTDSEGIMNYALAELDPGTMQRLKQHIAKQTSMSATESEQFSAFAELFYGNTPFNDMRVRAVIDLYGAALSQWLLMRQREPAQLKVKIFNPTDAEQGWESTHTIIQIITDDMPFLVDSVRMVLNQLGLTIHFMVYCGGIKVKRDANSQLVAIGPYQDESEVDETTNNEAPIYFEVDKQTDQQRLADIERALSKVLSDVRHAVADWPLMQQKMQAVIDELQPESMPQHKADIHESQAFLTWLLNNHFTFLGYRCYDFSTTSKQGKDIAVLKLVAQKSLGLLKDTSESAKLRYYGDLPQKAREQALSTEKIIIISKTNTQATVHRPAYTDLIAVKRFDKQGQLLGEHRFIGLFTSSAYVSDPRTIPLLRKKIATIFKWTGLPLRSHDAKDLLHILSHLPRDDLFHATSQELYKLVVGILHMQERRVTRLFIRQDHYGRFLSCLVYLPRENFTTNLVLDIRDIFNTVFEPLDITYTTNLSESILARVHYVVRLGKKSHVHYDIEALEQKIIAMSHSWKDSLRAGLLDYFGEEYGNELITRYQGAFPAGYREAFNIRTTIHDIEQIQQLHTDKNLGMSFYRPLGAQRNVICFKLYRFGKTVPLSDALPMLENMGLRVVGEQPYQINLSDGKIIWINDFNMTYLRDPNFEIEQVKQIFQQAFYNIWLGNAESDSLNRLVLEAQLNWREISMLRAYVKYMRQIGFALSEHYIADTLINNATIAKLLAQLFKLRFDPKENRSDPEYTHRYNLVIQQLEKALDSVSILDEDRIFRRFLVLIKATTRTNYFQCDPQGQAKPYISFKLQPTEIPGFPLPVPRYEMYVYSPRFEGLHLRSDKVARGGIRWSDRLEDYHTEISDLVKAQQVKNAIIVPAGGKGGFITKCLPENGSREEVMQEGTYCYQNFIRGLLDLIDNIVEGNTVSPSDVICYDTPDKYLVVAADKGTATFSDLANQVAQQKEYWLGDAFASGGATGYDHKKLGITARGAWVSAERHFQELGINVDSAQISIAGIGDMSGDVFGNGLLMSEHVKLVAAFNHVHIFLDPDPDPALSFAERKRLFALPRSAWTDYDTGLISKGGGIYSRFAKSIQLSREVKALLKISKDFIEPTELIKAILMAPVDLLWNGGIGTYVKASYETNADVGDRGNDSVRVNGCDLQAGVVCEGGNLGLTQLGRIEYAQKGGKINTDFIDNSAGVDCSDHEVNSKILLDTLVAHQDITVKQRNTLLSSMADEVAELVLQNNYHQNLAISIAHHDSYKHIGLYTRYINMLEKAGKINRVLEFLPNDTVLAERRAMRQHMPRPELAILFAYSKNILKEEIKNSELVNDPYLEHYAVNAFPTPLRQRFAKEIKRHFLAKEIVATVLSNRLISQMGVTFIYQMQDETGASLEDIIRAYTVVTVSFGVGGFYADIELLDYQVETAVQYEMLLNIIRLVRRGTRWLLRNRRGHIDIQQKIDEFAHYVKDLFKRLPKLVLGDDRKALEVYTHQLVEKNVPDEIAERVAITVPVYHALNIIEAATTHNIEVFRTAKTYFMLVDRLNLLWFRDRLNAFPVSNRWSVLARSAYKGDLDVVQRNLTIGVLLGTTARSIPGKINAWLRRHETQLQRWQDMLTDLHSTETEEFAILFVAIRELMELAHNNDEPVDLTPQAQLTSNAQGSEE